MGDIVDELFDNISNKVDRKNGNLARNLISTMLGMAKTSPAFTSIISWTWSGSLNWELIKNMFTFSNVSLRWSQNECQSLIFIHVGEQRQNSTKQKSVIVAEFERTQYRKAIPQRGYKSMKQSRNLSKVTNTVRE